MYTALCASWQAKLTLSHVMLLTHWNWDMGTIVAPLEEK